MSKEAMKLALEALESAEPKYTRQRKDQKTLGGSLDYWKLAQHQRLKAITALREALASEAIEQPAQQEPVATLWQHGETGRTRITMPGDITDCDARWFKAADLYTSPPAQRTWVGLTDEERGQAINANFGTGLWAMAKDIEAKLKEKNT